MKVCHPGTAPDVNNYIEMLDAKESRDHIPLDSLSEGHGPFSKSIAAWKRVASLVVQVANVHLEFRSANKRQRERGAGREAGEIGLKSLILWIWLTVRILLFLCFFCKNSFKVGWWDPLDELDDGVGEGAASKTSSSCFSFLCLLPKCCIIFVVFRPLLSQLQGADVPFFSTLTMHFEWRTGLSSTTLSTCSKNFQPGHLLSGPRQPAVRTVSVLVSTTSLSELSSSNISSRWRSSVLSLDAETGVEVRCRFCCWQLREGEPRLLSSTVLALPLTRLLRLLPGWWASWFEDGERLITTHTVVRGNFWHFGLFLEGFSQTFPTKIGYLLKIKKASLRLGLLYNLVFLKILLHTHVIFFFKSQKCWPKLFRDRGNFGHNVIRIGLSNYKTQFQNISRFSLEFGYETVCKMLHFIK